MQDEGVLQGVVGAAAGGLAQLDGEGGEEGGAEGEGGGAGGVEGAGDAGDGVGGLEEGVGVLGGGVGWLVVGWERERGRGDVRGGGC